MVCVEWSVLYVGKVIPDGSKARVAFVMNYVLDSLPCDLFKLVQTDGRLEAWKGVVKEQSSSFSGVRMAKSTSVPCELPRLFSDAFGDTETAVDQWLLWPTGALRALASLRRSAIPDQLFIVGDKMVDTLDASNWADAIPGLDR